MLDSLEHIDWQFSGKGDYHPVHLFHPYFAKFSPKLARSLITALSHSGDTVMDPFCGCGTTLVEATLLGRHSIGIDANPLGCFISQVKTTPISDQSLDRIEGIIAAIEQDIYSFYGIKNLFSTESPIISYNLPEFHNRDYWFNRNSLHELAIIKTHINRIEESELRDLLLLAFSRIIVYASNQQTESRYRRVEKDRAPVDIFREFRKTTNTMCDAIRDYTKLRHDVSVCICNKDSRLVDFIESDSIHLLVTSPPYLNSWDYGLYHRFRFFWLDMNVKKYEEKEIGKHLRTIEGRSKTDEIERYRKDMGMCLAGFVKLLKKGAYCCIVNANSIVNKVFVDTNQILIDEASKHGFNLVEVINRKVYGPHYGMHAALGSKEILVESEAFIEENGRMNKQEQILIFKKD